MTEQTGSMTPEPHQLYQQIMTVHQKEDELTEPFLAKKIQLFAKLPPRHPEEHQLDMVYGTLHEKITEKVPRDTVLSFDGLLEAAKCVEESMLSLKSRKRLLTEVTLPVESKKKRIRCSFCRNPGHRADECRKKGKAVTDTAALVARNFDPSDTQIKSIVTIEIENMKETAFIDMRVVRNVASYRVFNTLKARGFKFEEKHAALPFEKQNERKILTVSCNVNICGRTISTTFVIFPEERKAVTLLGADFIVAASMTIGQMSWHFNDDPTKIFNLRKEDGKRDDNTTLPTISEFK